MINIILEFFRPRKWKIIWTLFLMIYFILLISTNYLPAKYLLFLPILFSDLGLVFGGDTRVITSSDLAKTPNDYSQFYFEVYYGTRFVNKSGYLNITPIFPSPPVNLCSDYTNQANCIVNSGGIDFKNINPNCSTSEIILGCTHSIDCSCKWNVSTSTCFFDMKTTIDYNCYLLGGVSCSIDSSTTDDCSDNLLYYNETYKPTWADDNSFRCPSDITEFLEITSCNDDVLFEYPPGSGNYHYDPLNILDNCILGVSETKVIVCPVQTSISFFNYYNLIIALIAVFLIYFLIKTFKRK